MAKRLEIESRHSDWGEDAGGYAVLRFDGEWVGRVDRALAEKLIAYVEQLSSDPTEQEWVAYTGQKPVDDPAHARICETIFAPRRGQA